MGCARSGGRTRVANESAFRRVLDSRPGSLYNAPRSARPVIGGPGAQVAQLVEHVTENHGVGGSIPPLGTRFYIEINIFGALFVS
jgi:hypothetical protein